MSIFRKKSRKNTNEEIQIVENCEEQNNVEIFQPKYDNNLPVEEVYSDYDRDKLQAINNGFIAAQNIANNIGNVLEKREQTEQLRIQTNVKIANLTAKYKTTENYIDKTFKRSEKKLNANYKVLDYAIETDNTDLIIKTLEKLSETDTDSKLLSGIEAIKDLYDDDF